MGATGEELAAKAAEASFKVEETGEKPVTMGDGLQEQDIHNDSPAGEEPGPVEAAES